MTDIHTQLGQVFAPDGSDAARDLARDLADAELNTACTILWAIAPYVGLRLLDGATRAAWLSAAAQEAARIPPPPLLPIYVLESPPNEPAPVQHLILMPTSDPFHSAKIAFLTTQDGAVIDFEHPSWADGWRARAVATVLGHLASARARAAALIRDHNPTYDTATRLRAATASLREVLPPHLFGS